MPYIAGFSYLYGVKMNGWNWEYKSGNLGDMISTLFSVSFYIVLSIAYAADIEVKNEPHPVFAISTIRT
jgi:hypothetical protein